MEKESNISWVGLLFYSHSLHKTKSLAKDTEMYLFYPPSPPCFNPLASFKTLDRYYTPLYEKVKNMPMETNCFKGLLSAVQPRLVYVTSFMNVPNRHDKRVIL